MKKLLSTCFIAIALLFAGNTYCSAQSSADDTQASLDISRNIIKLLSALTKDYVSVKGDLITKTDDGTSVYSVKDIHGMMAETQYILVKSGGAAYYMASYSGDTKKLSMSFAAFAAGITTISNNGDFKVEQDKNKSTDDKLVYVLLVKGVKVGMYSMEVKKQEGTMIRGFL